jgi:DNA-binding XRE family transcriptional regulator
MIRNEAEYQLAVKRMEEEGSRLEKHEAHLRKEGLKGDALKRAVDPLRSFHLKLREEIECYERLKRGDLDELENLHGLGLTFVALRIALGMSQRELAEKLEVHETQVSRDERNEYHGITVERASRILDVLGVNMKSAFATPLSRSSGGPARRGKRAPAPVR